MYTKVINVNFSCVQVGKKIEEGNRRKYNPSTAPVVGTKCEECGQKFQIGGPIWTEPIHSKFFVDAMLKRLSRESHNYGTALRLTGKDLRLEKVLYEPMLHSQFAYHLLL